MNASAPGMAEEAEGIRATGWKNLAL